MPVTTQIILLLIICTTVATLFSEYTRKKLQIEETKDNYFISKGINIKNLKLLILRIVLNIFLFVTMFTFIYRLSLNEKILFDIYQSSNYEVQNAINDIYAGFVFFSSVTTSICLYILIKHIIRFCQVIYLIKNIETNHKE